MYSTIATLFPSFLSVPPSRVVAAPSQLSPPPPPRLLRPPPPPPPVFRSVHASLLSSSPLLCSTFHRTIDEGMANAMVSVPSSDLGPLGWNGVTKRQLFLQRVSSKLGPNPRQQGRGPRQDTVPTGPAAAATAPRPAPGEGSTSRERGGGSPTRVKQSWTPSHGEFWCFLKMGGVLCLVVS